VAASQKNLPSLAERIHRIRDQAEQLTEELEKLEKETVKK
jgi:ubiquinone biosynthesis protein UbiJ